MNTISMVLVVFQVLFTLVAGLYFYNCLKAQRGTPNITSFESSKELEKLSKLRSIHLTKPLSEKTRPKSINELVGQEDGLKALRAAICSPNPQHVIIYGPPGVGKTAAARLMLEVAKTTKDSPFLLNSKFIEMDATTIRFDERSIADPLIGSVHDPIYQGAGALGQAGVPQPKEGAVTKAHGGVLFIDEIGELHPIQMNKLLKVLEDRVVYLSSAYYNSESKHIPTHIHDIFTNGLPADFRLIGATTRSPEEIPPALRSRCTEIFFSGLNKQEIKEISLRAIESTNSHCDDLVLEKVATFAQNGRDAVNIVQTASSVALMEKRNIISIKDIEWVIQSGRYSPKIEQRIAENSFIGVSNGLGVFGSEGGALLQIEAWAQKTEKNEGIFNITGIVENEEIQSNNRIMKRKSMANSSVLNVTTVLKKEFNIDVKDYNIHINFPGGIPVDGPSAGTAIFTALYSAITKKYMNPKIAMTGEVSLNSEVLPVGGVPRKIEAAINAGATKVIIPTLNYQSNFDEYNIEIISTDNLTDLLNICFSEQQIMTA